LTIRAQGRLAEATRLCETTIADARRLGLDHWLAHPLYVRALLARDRGNLRAARQWIEGSIQRLTDADELAMLGQCYHFLGEIALLQGDLEQARMQLERSLNLSHQAGILRRVAATHRLLGDLARFQRQFGEAERRYHAAMELASRLGDRPQVARVLVSQAYLQAAMEQKQEAVRLLSRSKYVYQDTGDVRGEIATSLLLMRLHLSQLQLQEAMCLFISALEAAWSSRLLCPRIPGGVLRRR
jgi:tetratricopeptide (TPR) repeat protein